MRSRTPTRACARAAIEYLDNLLEGDVAQARDAARRRDAGGGAHPQGQRDLPDAHCATSKTRSRSCCTTRISRSRRRRCCWSKSAACGRSPTTSSTCSRIATCAISDVFEAASWALAANRVQAERRKQLWQEPLPAVELADRLRHVPLFDFTHVDELFRLARLGRQVRYEKGRALYERGEAVTLDPVPARRPRHDRRADRPRQSRRRRRSASRSCSKARRCASTIIARRAIDHAVADRRRIPRAAVGERRARRRHLPDADRDARPGDGPHADPRHLPPDLQGRSARPAAGRSRAAAAVEPAARARHRGAIVAAVGDRARSAPSPREPRRCRRAARRRS